MCGITGFCGEGAEADLKAMTDALWHRGPDEGNILFSHGLGFGHRRLSILDLAHGKQPMQDRETGAILVYNGEIYNHLELRAELEKLGHKFHSSHSDTETVLRSFLQWGAASLLRFNGMFAFAIYLPRKKLLWLARDRFGEKPLFYIHNRHGFAFASEILALRHWPGFSPEINRPNVQRYFAWNYLPGGRSINRGCKALKPGSWLCFNLASQEISEQIYWKFELHPDESWTDELALQEELRRLLVQSVRRRMLSDVPVGIFLSGGIDSSAVLAAACQEREAESLFSFTIGFNEKSFDESEKAARVAKHFGVKNQTRYLTEAAMQGSIDSVLSKLSEPFGDPSLIPTWQLCAFAKEHVTVALSGDGGDELFGGYDPLAAIRPARWYRKLVPAWLHSLFSKGASHLPASDKNMSLDFKIKRFLRGLSFPPNFQLPVWMSGLSPEEIQHFFEHPLSIEEIYSDLIVLFQRYPDYDDLEKALLFFTRFYLSDDILVKSDRASMMVSLETRAVFLDNDIAAFCSHLPMRYKYRNGKRKYLLKKALSGWLPPEIIEQPKKGFGIPLNLWLRHLSPPRQPIPGLKPRVLERCHALHNNKAGDFRFFLWDAQSYDKLAA